MNCDLRSWLAGRNTKHAAGESAQRCARSARGLFAGLEAPRFHLGRKASPRDGGVSYIKSKSPCIVASSSNFQRTFGPRREGGRFFVVGTRLAHCDANFTCTRVQISPRAEMLLQRGDAGGGRSGIAFRSPLASLAPKAPPSQTEAGAPGTRFRSLCMTHEWLFRVWEL